MTIIEFIREHGETVFKGVGNRELKKLLDAYKARGWYMELKDGDDIVALALWKIIDSKLCKVTHVIINRNYRGNGVLKKMIKLGLGEYPTIEYFNYERRKHKKKQIFCESRRLLNE